MSIKTFQHREGGIIHIGNSKEHAMNDLHVITWRRVSIYSSHLDMFFWVFPQTSSALNICLPTKVPGSITSQQLLTTLNHIWLDGITSKKNLKILWPRLLRTPNISCFDKYIITYTTFSSKLPFENTGYHTGTYAKKTLFKMLTLF